MTQFVLTAHVFFATLGFGMAIAFELLLVAVARSQHVDAIRTAYSVAARYRPLIGLSLLLAILLGFYLAMAGGYSLTAPWLLVSYAMIVVGGLTFGAFIQRRTRRILSLVADSDAAMSEELRSVTASVTPLAAVVLLIVMFVILGAMIR
ncbi:MAG TPA: DUF2269 family protein [Candidatus Acidoferrales bacterium]|nr:DUF2269 family protein [Candidatus Acidoferrales bacterium]